MMKTSHRSQGGFAFLTALILLVGSVGLSMSFFMVAHRSSSEAESKTTNDRVESAASDASDLLAQEVWNRFTNWFGRESPRLMDFRAWLGSGEAPFDLRPGSDGQFGQAVDALALLGSNDGSVRLGDMSFAGAWMRRRDLPSSTDVEIVVTAQTGDSDAAQRRTVRSLVTLGGEVFRGFEYGLLSNDVNCIMCHATFDNVERYYSSDPGKYGTHARTKIGTLESLMIRPQTAHSMVGGSLYTRGQLLDNWGNPLVNLDGTTLFGVLMDDQGRLVQDENGHLIRTNMDLAEGDPLPEFGQLYLDYPTDREKQTDGVLPDYFPPAIPDLNGNRLVDRVEFDAVAEGADGWIENGAILAFGEGESFEGTSIPEHGNTERVDGSIGDNLILVGTPDNPLVINGTVAVDGDVAIYGEVVGDGALYVSGNIYLLGDVTYGDGIDGGGYRTYGTAADGTPNALALAAGGNVLVGDYLSTPSWYHQTDVNGDGTGAYNFTMNEIGIFNRREWSRTQQTLPGINGPVENPMYIEGYLPRYYVLNDNDPVWIFNGASLPDEYRRYLYFDPNTESWLGIEAITQYNEFFLERLDPDDPAYQAAAVLDLSSDQGWLAKEILKALWADAEARHMGGPMEINALLYSNNSAWTMVRPDSRYQGKMILNGALVSADTGVLVPSGLQLNFDSRPGENVQLSALDQPVEMRRTVWSRLNY